jgi:hypothetical protein
MAEIPIEQLAAENNLVWIYSYDTKEDKVVPALAMPKYSGYRDDLVRVTLDNGESIVCTSDHLWLKRDGCYEPAVDLQEGDSLMPLYRSMHHGYEKFYSNKHRNNWITTHWMVVHDLNKRLDSKVHIDRCTDEHCKIIIHHKDFDPRNNSPDNLEPMLMCQHNALHKMFASTKSENHRRRWRENYDRLAEISINNIQEYNRKIATKEMKLTEKQIMARRSNILQNGMQNFSHEERSLKATKGVATRKQRYGNDIYSKLGKMGKKNGSKISDTLKRRYACRELPITLKQLEARRRNVMKLNNHKTIRVEEMRINLPVYDLVVPRKNCHNFALNAGVFVHNSGYGYLPYDFVLEGLAEDWWTLIEQGWVDTGQFGE